MEQKFDPALKAAMQEIRDVLEAYGLGASILLVSPSHSEFALGLPPGGCLKWEENSKGNRSIRVRLREAEYASKEEAHDAAEYTTHFIAQVRQWGVKSSRDMQQLLDMLAQSWDITEDPQDPYYHDADGERAANDPDNKVSRRRSILER